MYFGFAYVMLIIHVIYAHEIHGYLCLCNAEVEGIKMTKIRKLT